jgi:hypothetical protein
LLKRARRFATRYDKTLRDYQAVVAIEVGARKLGLLLLTLGVMHFFNMYLFHRIRRRSRLAAMPPPVLPHGRVASARGYQVRESVMV